MQISKFVGRAARDFGKKAGRLLAKQAHLPYVGPVGLWIIVFVVVPLGFIVYFSFATIGAHGEIIPTFTLKNYQAAMDAGYARILFRSFLFASVTNVLCLLIGYPLAYWIARYGGKWETLFLLLIILPSWTNYLIRLYAVKLIIGSAGLINSALLNLGLISSPLEILYTPYAVILGLAHIWLPFMVLPIYASLKGLDPSLLEASADLGAAPFRTFFTVTLPLTRGGIVAGTILVFIPSLGEWLVPLMLGGGKVMLAGTLVQHFFIKLGNAPMGCTIATFLIAAILLVVYLSFKLGGREALERVI